MAKRFSLKQVFEIDPKVRHEEENAPKQKRLVRGVYGGVRIPWLMLIIGWIIGAASLVLASGQADMLSKFGTGQITNSDEILQYVKNCLIASIASFCAIPALLGEVEIATRIRKKIWIKIMKLPAEYFDHQSPNRMISRVTQDPASAAAPFSIVRLGIVLLAMAIAMLLISSCNSTMMAVIVGGVIIVVILLIAIMPMMRRASFISANRLSIFTAFLSERLSNIKLVKASNAEETEQEQAEKIIEMRYKAGLYSVFVNAVNSLISSLNSVALYIACFLVGAALVKNGTIIAGADINAAYLYGTYIGLAFSVISLIPTYFAAAMGGMSRAVEITREREEDILSGAEMPKEAGDIRLENVSFSYDTKRKTLDNVSCTIPYGKVTAVVGPNGSGKSTIMKLIDRLYADVSGNIFIGESRADSVSLSAWRNEFGIVAQNASLFSGSIRDNICYGIEGTVSEERIYEIVKLACLEELIHKHPEGLDFDIGISGCRLSGGEQQRLAIARAMMKDPKYLILDEATANLDTKTEGEIKSSIAQLMKGRTVITIAHNYSAIEQADHIIVLDGGTVVGSGTHQDLITECAFYQKLAGADFQV